MVYTTHKTYRKITLPTSLIERINALELSNLQSNHCYHILYLLTVNPSRDRSLFTDWQPLANNYLRLIIGRLAPTYLDILGDANIIDCDGKFYQGKALCYRINKDIDFSEPCKTITFHYTSKIELITFQEGKKETFNFQETLTGLDINFDKLQETTTEYVNSLSLDKFTTNYDIQWGKSKSVDIIDSEGCIETTYLNKSQAMTFAANKGYDVIEDGKSIKIMDATMFLANKKAYVEAYYRNSIEALKDEATIYAKRNQTNTRLDTNFTCMPSELLDVIYADNNITEIDQANSQPALLAYKMELDGITGDDVEQFQKVAYEGSFYEYMAAEIGVDRKRAKKMMFEVLFSSSIANSDNKRVFQTSFPTVWEYIKDYKKQMVKKSSQSCYKN